MKSTCNAAIGKILARSMAFAQLRGRSTRRRTTTLEQSKAKPNWCTLTHLHEYHTSYRWYLIHSEHCEQGYLCYWQKFKTFIANVLSVAYSNEVNGSVDHGILWILGSFRADRSELNMTTMYSNLIFSISRAHRYFDTPCFYSLGNAELFLTEMKDLQR